LLLLVFCTGSKEILNQSTYAYEMSLSNKVISLHENQPFSIGSDFKESSLKPVKWALIIAIGDYPESGDWSKINAKNDVPLVKQILMNQGFSEEYILVIENENATKQGIIDAFNSHLLANVKEGDIVYVHFSSHGQQMFDASGDEVDGYDEAIVAYDANLYYEPGIYEGENHLKDDELGELLTQIRIRLGSEGSLLSVVDACHSGTATRGLARARGTKTLMEPFEYEPQTKFDLSNTSKEQSFIGIGAVENEEQLSPMVVISGASADQLNYETQDANGNWVGSLSHAFSKVLSETETKISYRELFDQIKIEMSKTAPNQNPQIEGDIDREVFGGNIIKQEPYFIPVEWYKNNTEFLINAGSLHGFTDSSTVQIFSFDVQDFENASPLGTGTVIYSKVMESEVRINNITSDFDKEKIKVVLESQSYKGLELKVQLNISVPQNQLTVIKQKLEEASAIALVESDADLVVEDTMANSRGSKFDIVTAQDNIIYSGEFTNEAESVADLLIEKIQGFAKVNFLRKMDLKSPAYKVEMELVPFNYELRRNKVTNIEYLDVKNMINEAGILEMEEKVGFKIKVNNKGSKRAYFTIANFTPDGKASLVVPYQGSQVQDFTIEPGQSKEIEYLYVIQQPFGNESLKLFATEQPLDLSPVLDPISRGSRSGVSVSSNPFQMVMENATSQSRAGQAGVSASSANIYTLTYKVVPAKK